MRTCCFQLPKTALACTKGATLGRLETVSDRIREYSLLTIRLADTLDLLALLVAIGLLILTAEGRVGVPRILLAIVFLLFVPGRAIVSNWPRLARWSEAAMSIVLSLTVLGLVATVALWVHEWHPIGLFELEAATSVASLLVAVARRHLQFRRVPARREARG